MSKTLTVTVLQVYIFVNDPTFHEVRERGDYSYFVYASDCVCVDAILHAIPLTSGGLWYHGRGHHSARFLLSEVSAVVNNISYIFYLV